MDTYNEKEIIALLQDPKRQREAFECIVKQYSEQLYWQIRRMVLSHDDANDLLQNTFIKAWINIDYFRAEAKMSTWLYRIALNECLTFLNKQRANNQLSIDEADAEMVNKLEGNPYAILLLQQPTSQYNFRCPSRSPVLLQFRRILSVAWYSRD